MEIPQIVKDHPYIFGGTALLLVVVIASSGGSKSSSSDGGQSAAMAAQIQLTAINADVAKAQIAANASVAQQRLTAATQNNAINAGKSTDMAGIIAQSLNQKAAIQTAYDAEIGVKNIDAATQTLAIQTQANMSQYAVDAQLQASALQSVLASKTQLQLNSDSINGAMRMQVNQLNQQNDALNKQTALARYGITTEADLQRFGITQNVDLQKFMTTENNKTYLTGLPLAGQIETAKAQISSDATTARLQMQLAAQKSQQNSNMMMPFAQQGANWLFGGGGGFGGASGGGGGGGGGDDFLGDVVSTVAGFFL